MSERKDTIDQAPLPWSAGDELRDFAVLDADGRVVASIAGRFYNHEEECWKAKATSELIVKCVNAAAGSVALSLEPEDENVSRFAAGSVVIPWPESGPKLEPCPYCKDRGLIEKFTLADGKTEAYAVGCDGWNEKEGMCKANVRFRRFIHATPEAAACEWNARAKLTAKILDRLTNKHVAVTVPELLDILRFHERGGATGCPCRMNATLTDAAGRRFYLGQIGVGVSGGGDGCAGADVDLEISCDLIPIQQKEDE